MRRLLKLAAMAGLTAFSFSSSAAIAFEKVNSKSEFMQIVNGKDLRLTGIRINLTADGAIVGRAFGTPVTGSWNWQDSYFCRTLYWGTRDLGQNCQEVSINGDRIRFQSDRGAGRYADLNLR